MSQNGELETLFWRVCTHVNGCLFVTLFFQIGLFGFSNRKNAEGHGIHISWLLTCERNFLQSFNSVPKWSRMNSCIWNPSNRILFNSWRRNTLLHSALCLHCAFLWSQRTINKQREKGQYRVRGAQIVAHGQATGPERIDPRREIVITTKRKSKHGLRSWLNQTQTKPSHHLTKHEMEKQTLSFEGLQTSIWRVFVCDSLSLFLLVCLRSGRPQIL